MSATCVHCGSDLELVPLSVLIGFLRQNPVLGLLKACLEARRAIVDPHPWVTLCAACGCLLPAFGEPAPHSH